MMGRFTELNEEAIAIGLDLLIFPQGTRAKRLLPGRVGIGQIALRLGVPIVPADSFGRQPSLGRGDRQGFGQLGAL